MTHQFFNTVFHPHRQHHKIGGRRNDSSFLREFRSEKFDRTPTVLSNMLLSRKRGQRRSRQRWA